MPSIPAITTEGGKMSDISARAPAIGGGDFSVGRVLGRSLTVLFRSFPKYLLFGVVMAVPNFFSVLQHGSVSVQSQSVSVTNKAGIGYLLLSMVLFALVQATMIQGAFQDIRGQSFDLGTSVRRGLGRFLPVLGTSICFTIALIVGIILLIVPGFIVLTMFLVAIPVCVVEALGPLQSLGRSRALTKGHRWKIFAIYIVPLLVLGIGSFILQAIGAAFAGITGAAVASFLIVAITSPYQALVAIVAYHDLRAVKEGLDIEQLAAVFD
jgi:hypothetical protein